MEYLSSHLEDLKIWENKSNWTKLYKFMKENKNKAYKNRENLLKNFHSFFEKKKISEDMGYFASENQEKNVSFYALEEITFFLSSLKLNSNLSSDIIIDFAKQ